MLYLGKQRVSPYNFLFAPDNSLIKQSYDPKLMQHIQNLAGFGMVAWDYDSETPESPYFYKTSNLPFFDANLLNLSKKIDINCLLSHVRGVEYNSDQVVTRENAHPYMFEGFTIALAHNGNITDMALMKRELLKKIKPEISKNIVGTTDSEWVYSVFVSQLEDPTSHVSLEEARSALVKTFQIFREVRQGLGIETASPVNLFATNGEYLLVTRFVFDYGCHVEDVGKVYLEYHSLWFTYGESYHYKDGSFKMKGATKRSNIIFASEPLTEDRATWIEIPEYTITAAWFDKDEIRVQIDDLNV